MKPFANAEITAKFNAYPPNVRPKLLALRELIFATATTAEGAGEIEETLKWGEPAYVQKTGFRIIGWTEPDFRLELA